MNQVGVTVEEAAVQRAGALASLAYNPERAELRAAGVAERTINTLCPVAFEEIVPSLITLLSGDYLAEVGPYSDWEATGVHMHRVIHHRLGAKEAAHLADFSSFCETDAHRALLGHLFENLPGHQHRGRAITVIHALWLVHWAGSDPELRTEIAHEIVLLSNWAAPQLVSQVALLTESKSVSEIQFVLAR